MKVLATKQVQEEIEIQTPAFFKRNWITKVTDHAIIELLPDSIIVTRINNANSSSEKIEELLKKGEPISEFQFNERFIEVRERINELAGISSFENVLQ